MAVLSVALPAPSVAGAQLEPTLDAQRFQLAPSYHSFVSVDTARLPPALGLGFDLAFDYAWRPLQVRTSSSLERQYGLINGLVGGQFRAAFAPAGWAEIDVLLPFMQLTQVGTGLADVGGNRVHYSLGDVEVAGRLRLLAEERAVGVALIPFVSFPTGSRKLYATRGTITLGARAALSRHWRVFHFGAHVGYRLVPDSGVLNGSVAVDDELLYGAGVGVSPVPGWLDVNVELMGAGIIGPMRFNLPPGDRQAGVHSPLELFVDARVKTPVGLDFVIGGGPGLTLGAGTPGFRVFFAASWAPPLGSGPSDDPDGDRIHGDADACPGEKEDKDLFQDQDGCPEIDNDGDGIADLDETDRACINKPEDMDGFQDDDGCPEIDNDGDGNPDTRDKCPLDPEDVDGNQDTDGCPDADNDGDGISDEADICPDDPEVFDGVKDDDGCPDDLKAVVKGEKIVILEKILFVTDSDQIIAESLPVLDAVKETLLGNAGIARVRIEGHTDGRADDDYNLELSLQRATAVMRYLVQQGVDPGRLEAVGYGETRPLVPDDTEENMQRNRRVEFTILDQG